MSGTTPFTGSLLSAAQAVSYAEGHKVSFASSKEKAEENRKARLAAIQKQQAAQQQKTNETREGTWA